MVRSWRRGRGIWRGCSSGWVRRSSRSGRTGWCWTRSRRLFGPLGDELTLRSELRRLFRWLNDRGVTAIVTGERGEGTLTRHGLEEYVSDCVVLLDHRVHDQISTRRLRVVKYRGSHHGSDEYPFLIDWKGFSGCRSPRWGWITTPAATGSRRVSESLTGCSTAGYIEARACCCQALRGPVRRRWARGFWRRGVSAASAGCCSRLRESPAQIARNMRSVGIDVRRWVDAGMLRIVSARPAAYGLETHLARLYRAVEEFEPANVVIDPLSSLNGEEFQLKAMLSRVLDHFKARQITAVMTTLIRGEFDDRAGLGISSVIDTWVDVGNLEIDGERNRGIDVLKSRGMAHSNQVREFQITSQGLYIRDVYAGERGVLMGSARRSQEARDRAQAISRGEELEAKRQQLKCRRSMLEAQIAALHDQLKAETQMLSSEIDAGERLERQLEQDRAVLASARGGTGSSQDGRRR